MLQRAGEGKKEKQRGTFSPSADGSAAGCDRKHEKMHVDPSSTEPFPDLLDGEPTSCQISQSEEKNSQGGVLLKQGHHAQEST